MTGPVPQLQRASPGTGRPAANQPYSGLTVHPILSRCSCTASSCAMSCSHETLWLHTRPVLRHTASWPSMRLILCLQLSSDCHDELGLAKHPVAAVMLHPWPAPCRLQEGDVTYAVCSTPSGLVHHLPCSIRQEEAFVSCCPSVAVTVMDRPVTTPDGLLHPGARSLISCPPLSSIAQVLPMHNAG